MFSTVTRIGVAAATAAALLAPGAASAQAYTYQGYSQNYGSGAYAQPYDYSQGSYYSRYGGPTPGYYDSCERQRDNQVAGGVVGATLGAVAGSQVAARGRRTEGSILGGVLGAVVGASAGRGSSNACDSRYDQSRYDGYQGDDRYQAYDRRDDGYAYDPRDDRDYDGRYDDRYPSNAYSQPGYGSGEDGCRLAESVVRLPDGRTESRYVRTCPDQYGRYRVVD